MFVRCISDPSMVRHRSCSKRRRGSLVLDRLRPHTSSRCPRRCRRSRSTSPGCAMRCLLLRRCSARRSVAQQVLRGLLISWHVSRRRLKCICRPRLMPGNGNMDGATYRRRLSRRRRCRVRRCQWGESKVRPGCLCVAACSPDLLFTLLFGDS